MSDALLCLILAGAFLATLGVLWVAFSPQFNRWQAKHFPLPAEDDRFGWGGEIR